MPTVRQQRALVRADQACGSEFCTPVALLPSSSRESLAAAGRARAPSCHVLVPGTRPEGYAGSLASPVRPVSLLQQTRAPGNPTTSDVCAFWGVLDVVAGFSRCSASWRPIRRGPVILLHLQSPGRQSQIVQQEFHCTRQRRNRRGTSRVVSTTLHDRKNASAATRGNKSCILRPREAAAAPGRGARACSGKAMRSQPAPRAGITR